MLEALLAPEVRLALAYAPRRVRATQLAAFALDARLAAIVANAREPVLAQLKLAWWRDRFGEGAAQPSGGEPVLAALAAWRGPATPLLTLVDGWESALNGDDPAAVQALANARAALGASLAKEAGCPQASAAAAVALRGWSLASTGEGAGQDWPALSLPRSLRALVVLYGLARHRNGQAPLLGGPAALAAAIRLGMIGR